MQNTKLEAIKQECLTLAHGLQMQQTSISNAITNLEYIRQMLEKLASAVDEACIGLNAPPPVQNKPDPSQRHLILEWISDNAYDYNDDFEGVVSTELNISHYSDNAEIGIDKEIADYERDNLIEGIITSYLEWAAQQTIETQEEGDENA